ncbi:MAG: hypothetical protein Q8Q23_02265 [bacterium]|nr:hypothetical protein [bacterium]
MMKIEIMFDDGVTQFRPQARVRKGFPVNKSNYCYKAGIKMVVTGDRKLLYTFADYHPREEEVVFITVKKAIQSLNLNGGPVDIILAKEICEKMSADQLKQITN